MANTIFAPTSGEVDAVFRITSDAPVAVRTEGVVTDNVALTVLQELTGNYNAVKDASGSSFEFTSSTPQKTILAAGTYKLTKAAGTDLVSAEYSTIKEV